MKFMFKAVLAIFSNQDRDTLNRMVTNELDSTSDFVAVELSNKSGLQQVNIDITNEDDNVVGSHKFFVVPMTREIIEQIGLALEDGKDEDEQREIWGDEVIDWINEVTASLRTQR